MLSTEELIDNILRRSQLLPGQRRTDIQRELRSHIEDLAASARESGCDEDAIEKLLFASFGDPAQIAQGFAWVYRHERRRLRVFTYTLSTLILAASLLVAILTAQTGLAMAFGTPIMKVLASRHTVIETLDILATVAVYLGLTSLEDLFERHRFQKAALSLTAALTILLLACAAAGLHANFLIYGLVAGLFFRTVQVLVRPKFARIVIVLCCFPATGFVAALQWSAASQAAVISTCASWLAMGIGYQLMTDLAPRVDAALLKSPRG